MFCGARYKAQESPSLLLYSWEAGGVWKYVEFKSIRLLGIKHNTHITQIAEESVSLCPLHYNSRSPAMMPWFTLTTQSGQSELLLEHLCVCSCNLVCFCHCLMSLMGRASYLYASQSAIEMYKWTLCWFSTTEYSWHPLIALIKAVMCTSLLINAVTSLWLTATFHTLKVTKVCCLTPSQVISMREPS